MRRRHSLFLAVLAAVLTPAAAAEGATPPEWDSLAAEMAQPWPGLMDARGRYPDYVQGEQPRNPPPVLA
jgi:hypothetical protein